VAENGKTWGSIGHKLMEYMGYIYNYIYIYDDDDDEI
jgi:hypothetical protein